MFLATACLSRAAMSPEQGKLVFTRCGGQYFLSKIWMAGQTGGHKLFKSRREVEIARNETAQQVVILVELR